MTKKILAAGFAACAMVALPVAAQTYSVGSNPQGSLAYATAAAISKVGTEDAGLRMRAVPQGGPVVTLPMAAEGTLDFSMGTSPVVAFAFHGRSMFDKRPQKNIRMVAAMFPVTIGIFVRKDSGIRSLEDLRGKRVAGRFTKQKIGKVYMDAMLATANLTMKDVVEVPVPSGVRSVQDFMSGKVDATMMSVRSGVVAQANVAVGGIRFLSLPNGKTGEGRMQKIAPGVSYITLNPAPNTPGVFEPTVVTVSAFVLAAGTKTPDDVVYKLVKALHGAKKKLAAAVKPLKAFNPSKMNLEFGVPVHPGALKFYKEIGQ